MLHNNESDVKIRFFLKYPPVFERNVGAGTVK